MKTKRRNEKTRLLLTLELAVILPAAALVVLSAWHVKHIQRDRAVEAAIQRDFSQVLAISEKQINHKAYELLDDVRTEFPAPKEACAPTLDKILAAHPYVAHLFMYSPETGMVFRSQSDRLKDEAFRDEADYLDKMFEGWLKIDFSEMSQKLAHNQMKGMPYVFEPGMGAHKRQSKFINQPLCLRERRKDGIADDCRHGPRRRLSERPVFPRDAGRRDHPQRERRPDRQKPCSHDVARQSTNRPPWAPSMGWDGGAPEVERTEGAFQGLTLAIKLRGTTLAAIGQRFALIS